MLAASTDYRQHACAAARTKQLTETLKQQEKARESKPFGVIPVVTQQISEHIFLVPSYDLIVCMHSIALKLLQLDCLGMVLISTVYVTCVHWFYYTLCNMMTASC